MDRREVLKRGGAIVTRGMLANLGVFEGAAGASTPIRRQPNIV